MRRILRRFENSNESDMVQPKPEQQTEENLTVLEAWEWYAPADSKHWSRLGQVSSALKTIGVDYLWLPPGCKGGWQGSNGYDTYDLYDLGEFDQKGHRATKWGSIEDLEAFVQIAHGHGLGLLWDAVLNHKSAADYVETCRAVAVDREDRTKEISAEKDVHVWTGYNFEARAGRYSDMKYTWRHFSGTDWEANLHSNEHLYRFVGSDKPGWATDVDDSEGNADFLMGNDLDYSQQDVRNDVKKWGIWITQRLGLAGFRLDAVKHFSSDFLCEWTANLDSHKELTDNGKPLLMIGEYWRDSVQALGAVIEKFDGRLRLFDVPLAGNMSRLSDAKGKGDLRSVMKDSLLKHYPDQAVPFVINHDTQSRYERDHAVTAIDPWFIPLAYAFILLRGDVSMPCVFYGDLYGISGEHPAPPSCEGKLAKLILARKLLAYGPMVEYLDRRECIGFTRQGATTRPEGLAVVMGNSVRVEWKRMDVGGNHAGEIWTDILGNHDGSVAIEEDGGGTFPCSPASVCVWSRRDGRERAHIDEVNFDSDIYGKATSS